MSKRDSSEAEIEDIENEDSNSNLTSLDTDELSQFSFVSQKTQSSMLSSVSTSTNGAKKRSKDNNIWDHFTKVNY